MRKLAETLRALAPERLKENEPMSRHTTFRVGGPAELMFFPASAEEVRIALNAAREANAGVHLLGISGAPLWNGETAVLFRESMWFFLAALVCGLPVRDFILEKLHVNEGLVQVVGAVALVVLTGISISYIAVNSYNPFIYFNF